ncbi:MAG TPA: prepilin-type N-terminal cleavage/methylation domain-containing protein [Candidatus Acidoferrales bacterium]|jgi:type IV pilus assembly protein PilA|nr:prepilin-type N-terminal cleavage/methylation domain-containing protein [Candidatus Acidoferrales bacterium]
MNWNWRDRGFSLLELLIVVAIILTLMLVAIPNVSKMRMNTNETSALKTLDTLRTVCFQYQTSYGTFPAQMSQLGPPQGGSPSSKDAADLIDSNLAPTGGAPASKDGYTFRYVPGPADTNGTIVTYSVFADPLSFNNTGTRRYFMDQSTHIRFTTDGSQASATSPQLTR